MKPVTVVKLGGSVVTNKSKDCTPDLVSIHHITNQIAEFDRPLILLHGAGSYAHPFVTRAGIQKGFKGPSQLRSISETELYLDQLTRIIGVSLLLQDIPFVPIRPMSFLEMDGGEIRRSFLDPVADALKIGLVPLIPGDIAFDASRGCGVVSADRLASFLGMRLRASKILFGCDVDGVYSEDPKVSARARLIEEITKENFQSVVKRLARSRSSDATGGMLGKVMEAGRLARSGRECYIFNLKKECMLRNALLGRISPCTRFPPWKP